MPAAGPTRGAPEVDALLARLDHPAHATIQALRALILDADPRIAESVKWNAPSFATTEYFATFHLRARTEGHLEDDVAAQVAVLGPRPANGEGLVAGGHMRGPGIRIGIHRDGVNSHASRGARHPAGDLAAIGDEQAREHVSRRS